ncbi:MAG: CBS domain-containing protein [Cyanobacteria bacterium P01_H01_bin.15]
MMKASDVMTSEVVMIKGTTSVTDAVELMKSKQIRALIVERRTEADPYGILTDSDVVYKVAAYGKNPQEMKVYQIMTKPCITVSPELGVEYVARLFANTRIHRAPVIDGGKLLGVISLSDILHKSDFVEKPKSVVLSDEIQKAIVSARQVSAEKGATSKEAAAAWDIVEELEAEAAHQRAEPIVKSAFDEYCDENPDAFESREYDV